MLGAGKQPLVLGCQGKKGTLVYLPPTVASEPSEAERTVNHAICEVLQKLLFSNRNMRTVALVILVLSVASAQTTHRRKLFDIPETFTANAVLQTGSREIPMGKMYRSGRRLRMDYASGNLYMLAVPLGAEGHAQSYKVDAAAHSCTAISEGAGIPNYVDDTATVKRTLLRTQIIDGHVCRVERLVVAAPGMPTTTTTIWEAQDLGNFPLRIDTAQNGRRGTIRFENVSLGKPDDRLFRVPPECRVH